MDWIGVVAEVSMLEVSPVVNRIVEVVICADVAVAAEETAALD